jgi:hypothetical protein
MISVNQILVNYGLLYSLLSKYSHSFSVIKNTRCIATSGSDTQYWSSKVMSLSNVHPSNTKTLNCYMKVFKPALEDYHLAHASYSNFFQLEVHKQCTHY